MPQREHGTILVHAPHRDSSHLAQAGKVSKGEAGVHPRQQRFWHEPQRRVATTDKLFTHKLQTSRPALRQLLPAQHLNRSVRYRALPQAMQLKPHAVQSLVAKGALLSKN